MIRFREAVREDVPAVVEMLADDALGAAREGPDMVIYYAAFDAMQGEGANLLLVGIDAHDHAIATYQLTFISGLSLKAAKRAQIESVRVASSHRGHGIGREIVKDAERRARQAGCTLLQLTSNQSRTQALAFYEAMDFSPSHVGFKKYL